MHVESCPKCGAPGWLVRDYQEIGGKLYGPYPVVNHYVAKRDGYSANRRCFISLKKLNPSEGAHISNLLAQEESRERKTRDNKTTLKKKRA